MDHNSVGGKSSFSINVVLNEKEFVSLNQAMLYKNNSIRLGMLAGGIILFLWIFSWFNESIRLLPAVYSIPVVFFVIFPVSIIFISKKSFTRFLKEPREYTFYEEGFEVRSPSLSLSTKWIDIQKIIELKKFILLFNIGSTAMILPKRCFKSKNEVEFLKIKIQELNSKTQKGLSIVRQSVLYVILFFVLVGVLSFLFSN